MHVVFENPSEFLGSTYIVRQEVLPVIPFPGGTSDWVNSFETSLVRESIIPGLTGNVDEVALIRRSADKRSAEVRIYRPPSLYRSFNAFLSDEREKNKLAQELSVRLTAAK